jgi:hypothetical protein
VDIELGDQELLTEVLQTVKESCAETILITRSVDVRFKTLNNLANEVRDDLLRLLGWLWELIELGCDIGNS